MLDAIFECWTMTPSRVKCFKRPFLDKLPFWRDQQRGILSKFVDFAPGCTSINWSRTFLRGRNLLRIWKLALGSWLGPKHRRKRLPTCRYLGRYLCTSVLIETEAYLSAFNMQQQRVRLELWMLDVAMEEGYVCVEGLEILQNRSHIIIKSKLVIKNNCRSIDQSVRECMDYLEK